MVTFSGLSDPELVALLQLGDSGAFKAIYERYSTLLLNHAYNKTRNREEAKDIVHEVFAALWANHEHVNPEGNILGFLYTCVRNVFFNQVARNNVQAKYKASILEFSQIGQIVTDYQVRERQLSEIINKEIEKLPSKMGEVFKLSRNEYLTHKQIAQKLDISEQTVSKHITNALKVLRVKLGVLVYFLWLIHNK